MLNSAHTSTYEYLKPGSFLANSIGSWSALAVHVDAALLAKITRSGRSRSSALIRNWKCFKFRYVIVGLNWDFINSPAQNMSLLFPFPRPPVFDIWGICQAYKEIYVSPLVYTETAAQLYVTAQWTIGWKKVTQYFEYRTRAIISACLKISIARKFSKISMPKTLKPYFLDIIVDTKA